MTIDASDTHGRATAPDARDPDPPRAADAPAGPARSGMGREARRRIGRNLRILYADVLDMPLPDRFEALLAELSGQAASREDS